MFATHVLLEHVGGELHVVKTHMFFGDLTCFSRHDPRARWWQVLPQVWNWSGKCDKFRGMTR